jgi:hypothetical protein
MMMRECEGDRCYDICVRLQSGGDRDDDERL